jgi:hypothetical protein
MNSTVSFTEGYKARKGYLVSEYTYKDGKCIENTFREPVPATPFLSVKGNTFEVILHKCPPGKKDYLIKPQMRSIAKIKIQGDVAKHIFNELAIDSYYLWNVRKKYHKDKNGHDTEVLRSVTVPNLRLKDIDKVLSVVAKVLNFDASTSHRLYTFMDALHQVQETEEYHRKVKNDRDQLLKQVLTHGKITPATQRLIQDLAIKEPTEKRNWMMRKALEGYYGEFSSRLACPITTLIKHLEEVGCFDLAAEACRGRYDDDIGEISKMLRPRF